MLAEIIQLRTASIVMTSGLSCFSSRACSVAYTRFLQECSCCCFTIRRLIVETIRQTMVHETESVFGTFLDETVRLTALKRKSF